MLKKNKKITKDLLGKFEFRKYEISDLNGKIKFLKSNYHPKENIKKLNDFIQKKPYTSFLGTLGIFLVLLVIGNLLFSAKPETQQNPNASKKVNVFKLGSAPTVTFQGKVEKSGVVKIIAQMPGIVTGINTYEGEQVFAGTNLVSLSTNYNGGNTLLIARQIAQTQYDNIKDTYGTQGDIIGRQKDIANKNHDNTILLQQITAQSVEEATGLSELNKSIVASIQQQIATDKAGGASQSTLTGENEMLSQFQSALNGVNASLRSLQLQISGQPTAQIADQQYEITVRQLDIQRKALDLSLDLSKLQYQMALTNEANMYPSTPFSGTVDRIFVKVGDSVSPGDVLASISGNDQHIEIVVNVPQNIAQNLSILEPSILHIADKQIKMMPTYVSKDATNGTLYSVIFQLDNFFTSSLSDGDFINVELSVGTADTTNEVPFIPLDAIVQTQEESYVYVIQGNVARVKKITLGEIQGDYVEVTSGLPKESQVILDRNVIEGDKVSPIR